jgi:transglutaminase-like putative cysteine protease
MRIAFLSIMLCTALFAPRARAEQYRIAPEPAWVTTVAATGHAIPSPTANGDVFAVLADIQVNRAIDPPEAHFHFSMQAVNELGVPEVSQLSTSFDPSYQSLLIHRATIHRKGQELPVPIRGHVQILYREDRLEDQIYDGQLTAVLLVDDVRSGDIVEWSYTLRGANPVLASHYTSQWQTMTTAPLGLLHRRLLWPTARPLLMMPRNSAVLPTVTRRGDVIEYDLLIRDVPQVEIEPAIPGWYDPLRPIAFTDVSSWEDIARWGTTLFQAPTTLTPAIRARVAEFARADRSPEERAMAAVRFVQNEIRYLGIEIGENSHRATAPDVVLARRFGDCKDKALLLVTFLRALGFEAQPALVSTVRRDSILTLGPSAMAFDHVIVRTRSNGKTYWIDATDTGQRGDAFARMAPPPFGLALVIGDSTRGLSRIVPDPSLSLTTIEKTIDAHSIDAPAALTVQTDYFGDEAAAARLRVRANGQEELTRTYLEFYRRTYPTIVGLSPLRVEDDEALNRVRIVEHYSIPGFWQKESGKKPYGDFSAIELLSEVPSWRKTGRAMPLWIASPHRTIYNASIDMPDELREAPEDESVRTPAVVLTTRKTSSAKRFTTYHEIVFARDYLTAEETNAAVDDFRQMELALSTEFGREVAKAGAGGNSLLPWIMALMAATMTLLLVVALDRAPVPAAIWRSTDYAASSESWIPDQPIGGWLLPFGFGLVVRPFISLYTFATTIRSAHELVGFGLKGANAKYEIVGLVETVLTTIAFVYSIALLVLFLKRRRMFFRAFVGGVVLSIVISVVDIVALQVVGPNDPDTFSQAKTLFQILVSSVIWCLYFVRSRRVEATFVH